MRVERDLLLCTRFGDDTRVCQRKKHDFKVRPNKCVVTYNVLRKKRLKLFSCTTMTGTKVGKQKTNPQTRRGSATSW